ncbi:MAG: DUF302 domain-containing protein [Fibrobacteria bacterium]
MAIENFGYALTLKGFDFADAKGEVMDALNLEGFVELSEIDVKETLKESLGIEFRNYLIVGVWHPELAYEALGAEPNAGLLIPYNVVLQDRIEAEGIVVSLQSPALLMAKVGNHELESISRKTDGLIQKVVLALGGNITGKHPTKLEDVIPMHPKAYPARHMKEKLDGRREEGYELP